ncbi:MAG: type I restriction-modification enzyme R subunit C-terminal domain-containing protein [Anaerolineae bacterium]
MTLSEHATRKRLIDQALMAAGWGPIIAYQGRSPRGLIVYEEYPTANGPADYILFENGLPIAIVEAKKLAVGPQNVLQQAQRYARGVVDSPFQYGEYRVPFIYSTNGEKIWFQDLRDPHSRSREVRRFHTPAALRELLARDKAQSRAWLQSHPIAESNSAGLYLLRPYQRDAIASVESALEQNKRQMLVAMATGTGKTLTTIALLYRLMEAGLARRVLFLVDRRALAAQAVSAFARFEPAPGLKFDRVYEVYSQRFQRQDLEEEKFDPRVLPTSYLTNPDGTQAFVYICTIQRMRINLFGPPDEQAADEEAETDAPVLDIPIHAFDVIVADECHRGYTTSETGKWRAVLDHFDGVKIGLTATPAAHTTAYFKDIVYRYEYDRAVREGYLVDYDPVVIQSDIAMRGAFLRPGELVTLQDRATGQMRFETLEDERELPASELDQEWAAPDRDTKVVQELAKYLRAQEEAFGHFPKTLLFAHNDLPHVSHADRLVNLLRDEFHRGDAFVCKITGSPNVDRPLQRIREFRNRPEPGIVVTVDMLSTGVDIPALENIVLLRPIRSRILFEQMLGRGTRRCDEIGKTKFTVFDAAGALDYFAHASAFTADPPDKPTRMVREVIAAIYNNEDRDYNTRILVRRLQRVAKDISAAGRELFTPFIPDGDIAAFARALPDAIDTDWAATMRVLRDPEFQRLLTDYPRPTRTFIIAESAEDFVTSGYLIRLADGQSVRPDDYLASFERFVRDNPDHVEAIRILLERPAGWRTDTLRELRARLSARPEHYTEDNLRRAYQNNLADIISMVKHAASGQPLLSAEERVDRAIAAVLAGQTLTPDQQKWLDLIRRHLVVNLAIDRADLDLLEFELAGATYPRLNADFDGRLDDIMQRLNEAIAE